MFIITNTFYNSYKSVCVNIIVTKVENCQLWVVNDADMIWALPDTYILQAEIEYLQNIFLKARPKRKKGVSSSWGLPPKWGAT